MKMNFDFINIDEFKFRVAYLDADNKDDHISTFEGSESEKNNSPTLVFLHEGLGCIEMWRDFPQQLCNLTGYNGFLFDRLGYGGSDAYPGGAWPYDYLLRESTVFLPSVLNICKIENPVLIGHSDGGTISLLTAAYTDVRICGIITEAAHIFVEPITIKGIEETVELYHTTSLKEKLSRYHKNNTDVVFQRWAKRWLSPEFENWNISQSLNKINCPVLVIQGKDDSYGTIAQVDGICSGVSGNAIAKMIDNCGHVPHLQAKEAVLNIMSQFIRNLKSI